MYGSFIDVQCGFMNGFGEGGVRVNDTGKIFAGAMELHGYNTFSDQFRCTRLDYILAIHFIDREDPAIIDLAPTALRLFGVAPPPHMEGRPVVAMGHFGG